MPGRSHNHLCGLSALSPHTDDLAKHVWYSLAMRDGAAPRATHRSPLCRVCSATDLSTDDQWLGVHACAWVLSQRSKAREFVMRRTGNCQNCGFWTSPGDQSKVSHAAQRAMTSSVERASLDFREQPGTTCRWSTDGLRGVCADDDRRMMTATPRINVCCCVVCCLPSVLTPGLRSQTTCQHDGTVRLK